MCRSYSSWWSKLFCKPSHGPEQLNLLAEGVAVSVVDCVEELAGLVVVEDGFRSCDGSPVDAPLCIVLRCLNISCLFSA